MILLIDNYDSFTWNLVQCIGSLRAGIEIGRDLVVARNDGITPDEAAALDHARGPSHIIISPGPCGPREAGVSAAIIRRFLGRVPILGVCLGHQTLADVHGMKVEPHAVPVHGKTSEIHHDARGVFSGLPSPFTAARYHSLVVRPDSIPPRGEGEDGWGVSAWALERDPGGRERRVVMGLRRVFADKASAPAEGVQFHPESFLTEHGAALLNNFLEM